MLPFTPHPAGPSFSASAESHFNPSQLVSESDYVQEDAVEDRKLAHPRASPVPSSARHTRFEGLANFYYTLSYTLGFKEKYSLSLFIVLGGALVCYCFARTLMMNPDNVRDKTIPGEWFWYRQDLYKPCIMLHIYLSIISGIFVVFQFLPAIRRRSMILHRINGYMSLILLVPSTITGSIVARRAYGGELNSQSAFWTIGIMTIFSAAVGILNVKKTRVHRKWMLRTVAFAAAPITGRIISIMARYIVTQMGIYHAIWRCDEILYLLNTTGTSPSAYPQCIQPGVHDSDIYLTVEADAYGDRLGLGSSVRVTFGMSLWLALVIHIIGVEVYIRKTERSNQHRRGFVLERIDLDEMDSKRQPDDN